MAVVMHVEVRQNGDVVIVDMKGKLTAGLGDQILREAVDELLAENRKKILLNLSDRVKSTLYMARLLPIFEMYGDEAEALKAFGYVH